MLRLSTVLAFSFLLLELTLLFGRSSASPPPTAPYIYIESSGGQMMGQMFGKSAIYIGYDGTVQKTSEENGNADTVQELLEGKLGGFDAGKFFQAVRSAARLTRARSVPSPNHDGSAPVVEHASASTAIEILYPDGSYSAVADPAEGSKVLDLVRNTVKKASLKAVRSTRYLRVQRLVNLQAIEQLRHDNLVRSLSPGDLAKSPTLDFAVHHERRLTVIGKSFKGPPDGQWIRYPYLNPYAVYFTADGIVYSARFLTD